MLKNTAKYFQDKIVLLLLSLNIFLALLVVAIVALRISSSSGEDYIVQYRASLGIGTFQNGSMVDFVYIMIFAVLAVAFHITLSLKTYHISRQLAALILSMSGLLLIVALLVSNALLVLR